MKFILMMNMMINMMMLMVKHPLSMGIIIIIQAMMISMVTGILYKSFWFSYILFLMFVGGMMVLFMYMTSLLPNMMFSTSMLIMTIMITSAMMIMIYIKPMMTISEDSQMYMNEMMLMKMYSSPINMTTLMMSIYLLFTMITVFKITELNKGPLRKMN